MYTQEDDSFSRALNGTFSNATRICREYAEIKTYQVRLYQLLGNQYVSNTSILSIVYFLQKARELLQEIQVSTSTFHLMLAMYTVYIYTSSIIITRFTALAMMRKY